MVRWLGLCMFSCCDSSSCCSGGCGIIESLLSVEAMVFWQLMVVLVALLSVVALGVVGSLVFAVTLGMAVVAVCVAK